MKERMRNAPAAAAGLAGRLAHAVWVSLIAALLLALWNVLQVTLASDAYRDEASRALDLLWIAFGAYLPFVALPVLVAALVLRRPGARVAAAAGAGAALVAIGLLAQRGPWFLLWPAPAFLDACVAAGAAAASGWAAYRLHHLMRLSARAAWWTGVGVRALAGLQIALLLWAVGRDQLGRDAGRMRSGALGLAALAAGISLSWLLGALIRRAASIAAASRRIRPGGGAAALGLIGALGAGAVFFAPAQARTSAQGGLNIVLLVADTLRADRLGAYGAARARTPVLDALAAGGARLERAYANSSWTGPATASILTGLHPSTHGFMTYQDRIHEGVVSLAEILQDAGYATAGISANPILAERFGFGAGFDLWDEEIEPSRLGRHRSAPITATLAALKLWSPPAFFPRAEIAVDKAIEWLEGRGRSPFFLYVQFMDPHDPYAPPPPYDMMYGSPGSEPLRMRFGTLPQIMQGTQPVGPDDLERLTALYDGTATYVDDQIGRLLREMETRGWMGNTLVVFTSDHGEEFNDHGGLGHEHTLYEELVRIPLILAGPGVRSGRVLEGSVSQIDVAPTLIEAAGLAVPSGIEGDSIWGALSREEALPPREVFMEESYIGIRSPWHGFRALRQGDLKLIGRSFHPRGRDPWRWELYDLARDPAERHDLAAERTAEVEALRARIEEWARRPAARRAEQAPLDEETERRLRALGYVQ